MVARRLRLALVASLCGLGCVAGTLAAPVVAEATSFGTYHFGEEGSGSGQLAIPVGVAVNNNPSSLYYGDVYVGDQSNHRVDRFSGSGAFQSAWGWGVASGANELQTCTTSCQRGQGISKGGDADGAGGTVGYPGGVAVDNDPLSSSTGDIYVVEGGYELNRVEKFGPNGEFLLTFGGDVNETTGGDVCLAGENCKFGTSGTANGQFDQLSSQSSNVAVGPGGAVYVGDRARVQVFEPTGVWRESISLVGLSSKGIVTALAVDAAGDVFVNIGNNPEGAGAEGGVAGVREFAPDGVEKSFQLDAGSTTVTAIAVSETGDVFVGDENGGFHVLKYDSSGKETGSFGSNTVILPHGDVDGNKEEGFSRGLALSEGSQQLYAPEWYAENLSAAATSNDDVWALTVPPPGPSITSESATPGPRSGNAILEASIDPQGNETHYHFEYVDQAGFEASGYAHASSTPAATLAAGLTDQTVTAGVSGLSTSTIYHYRVVASNSEGAGSGPGPDETFTSLPAAFIDAEYTTNVAATSATIDADINPLGQSTEYRLEYGTSPSYGVLVTGDAGESTNGVLIESHLQGLTPSTTYYYRFVVHNESGTVEGQGQSFATQTASIVSSLPDGRTWELVSPADKKGALIGPPPGREDQIQAADDGSGITYVSEGPHVGEDPQGNTISSQILAKRVPDGWSNVDITLPSTLPETGEGATELALGNPDEYPLFSSDLSLSLAEPTPFGTPLLSPEASERTLYLRENASGAFSPLVSAENVPPGTKIEEPTFLASAGLADDFQMHFLAGTPDLRHVVLKTPLALTENAIDEESVEKYIVGRVQWNLYEWGEGKLKLVNILPGNEGVAHGPGEGSDAVPGVRLAGMTGESPSGSGSVQRNISSDGRRIAWTWGEPYKLGLETYKGLYVRDTVEEKTLRVGGASALFQTMSSDGSKIFYLENGDLYEFDFDTGTQIDLTAVHGAGEASARVQEAVSDVSEDGSYVYFVAKGVLASGGLAGADNLYLLHDTEDGWTTTFLAELSSEDEKSWYAQEGFNSPSVAGVSSRVSPDGRYLTFMSDRSLTGYDNTDAVSGQPDEEVYLYDAKMSKLVCASCDPTGARPVGVLDDGFAGKELLVDPTGVWGGSENGSKPHWLAASIPGWDGLGSGRATYQPRYLSNSGRLFFDSPVGLVAQDTNGLEDVYEYEPVADGETVASDECTTVSTTFSERSGGCVNLISSGTSSAESAFYDASENGDDVFFSTTSKLVGEDYDKGYDVYDAHVCSASVPCVSEPVSPPPCTSGDSCKAAPSPQPAIFGPTPSATFNGIGNVTGTPMKTVAVKSLTNAQKLVRALKVCRKKRGRARGVCERKARKRYPVKGASKIARTTGKGGR
jgi:hypothetical protein